MTLVGVTALVRQKVAAAITAGGLTCLPYDSWSPPQGSEIAALGALVTRDMAGSADQAWRIGKLTFPVYVYQLVDASIDNSVAYSEASFEKLVDAIGHDPTCGGYVVTMEAGEPADTTLEREQGSSTLTLVAELQLVVTPHPNIAAEPETP